MKHKRNDSSEQTILSAWREQVTETARDPLSRQQLLFHERELLPRFATQYGTLRALPRQTRRHLQRHWKRSLAGVALLLALSANPALAATIKVGGACTLIRAIVAANNNTTATGHCVKGSDSDTIVLPANSTQTLMAANNNVYGYGPTGLPIIRGQIYIEGNGSTIRRAPTAPNFRVFAVAENGFLQLSKTTVSGGVAATTSTDPIHSSLGGGVFNNCGGVNLFKSTVSGNKADREGGGVDNAGDAPCYGGVLTASNSIISGNTAGRRGGGVSNSDYSTVSMINTTISGNTSRGDGGGVANGYISSVNLTNSTISGNKAGSSCGGVLNSYRASARLTNSTVSGNTAGADGGGVCNQNTLYLTHTTLSGNKAGSRGGGVFDAYSGRVTDLFLERSLISGNTATTGREILIGSTYVNVTAANFNLFGHAGLTNAQALVGFTPGATDITATSNGNRPTALGAILKTGLANNGGLTSTHALVAGSPAVDAVNDGTCPPPTTDQRRVKRPRDGNGDGGLACDIGAFER